MSGARTFVTAPFAAFSAVFSFFISLSDWFVTVVEISLQRATWTTSSNRTRTSSRAKRSPASLRILAITQCDNINDHWNMPVVPLKLNEHLIGDGGAENRGIETRSTSSQHIQYQDQQATSNRSERLASIFLRQKNKLSIARSFGVWQLVVFVAASHADALRVMSTQPDLCNRLHTAEDIHHDSKSPSSCAQIPYGPQATNLSPPQSSDFLAAQCFRQPAMPMH